MLFRSGSLLCLHSAELTLAVSPNTGAAFACYHPDGSLAWQVPAVACPQRATLRFTLPPETTATLCVRPFTAGSNRGFGWGRETFVLGTVTGGQTFTTGVPFAGAQFFLKTNSP